LLALVTAELRRHDMAVETELAENLDLVADDHGQLGGGGPLPI
jgi:hypothetical protein